MFSAANELHIHGGNFAQLNVNDPSRTPMQMISQVLGPNYVPSATHDNNVVLNAPKCHSGTRVAILQRLSSWVKDSENSVHVSWLHGPAGAGKTAIAYSLAERLKSEGLLAGSFFFFRADASRNSEKAFVATLSYQLARFVTDTQEHIAKSLTDDPAICSLSLRTQFELLIVKPIVSAHEANPSLRPMLIIIDGLDECEDQGARNFVLQTIYEALPCLDGQIKFLILSRPEYDIQRSFQSAPTGVVERLDSLQLESAYDDVRRYLRDKFDNIKKSHPLRTDLPPHWPANGDIEKLVEKSSGHFIYASTVVKYIQNDLGQPQRRLEEILKLRSPRVNKPYAVLDELYLNILASTPQSDRTQLINILSIVVFGTFLLDKIRRRYNLDVPKALTYQFVETILSLQTGDARIALLGLSSLVNIEEDPRKLAHSFILFWHKSFSDFLLDASRSREFYVRSASAYTTMTKGCLRLLSDTGGLITMLWPRTSSIKLESRLICHLFLSRCCLHALPDLSLQKAMMEYEFISMPMHIPIRDDYFRILCSCLQKFRRAPAFKDKKIVAHLLGQFDRYLKSELKSCVPFDADLMNTFRASILPHAIKGTEFRMKTTSVLQVVDGRNPPWPYFLTWMAIFSSFPMVNVSESPETALVCESFHSKDRAGEYYLGHRGIGSFFRSSSRTSSGSIRRVLIGGSNSPK